MSEVVFQESPQCKARLVHLLVLGVVEFSLVQFFRVSGHHVHCRNRVNVQLPVGAAFLSLFVRQLLVHGPVAVVKVPNELH